MISTKKGMTPSTLAPAKTKIIYYQECTREWQVKKKVLSLLLQNNYHFTRIFFRLRNIFYKLRFYNRLKNLSFAQNFMADQKWLILERSENISFLGISAMATLVIKFWTFKLILRYTFYKLRFTTKNQQLQNYIYDQKLKISKFLENRSFCFSKFWVDIT